MQEKLWKDCSEEEKKAVAKWNKKRKLVFKKYKEGKITKKQFLKAHILLHYWLKLIEERYEDKEC